MSCSFTVIWIDLKVVQISTPLQGISPIEVDIEKAKARIPRNETRVQSAEVRVLSVSTVQVDAQVFKFIVRDFN